MTAVDYPAAPWRLRGQALVSIGTVPVHAVRRILPSGLRAVAVRRGRTPGFFLLASYTSSSTIEYNELLIAPAFVIGRCRPGFWISHAYVDHPASMAAGRAVWGLPKEPAVFKGSWDRGCMSVTSGGKLIVELKWSPGAPGIPVPLFGIAMGTTASLILPFIVNGAARVSSCRPGIASDLNSPLQELGFMGKPERALHLQALSLQVHAPH